MRGQKTHPVPAMALKPLKQRQIVHTTGADHTDAAHNVKGALRLGQAAHAISGGAHPSVLRVIHMAQQTAHAGQNQLWNKGRREQVRRPCAQGLDRADPAIAG